VDLRVESARMPNDQQTLDICLAKSSAASA
jgi:hypothetical protein